MVCKNCKNKKDFTMIKEIAEWNADLKGWAKIPNGNEYAVCDKCSSVKVDFESSY